MSRQSQYVLLKSFPSCGSVGGSGALSWVPTSPQLKRHLGRLSRFAGLTVVTNRRTHRHTAHATPSVAMERILNPNVMHAVRSNNNKKNRKFTFYKRLSHCISYV